MSILINKETKEVVCLDMKTEKHIFHFLGMKFKEPHERINANSVELLDTCLLYTSPSPRDS